MTFSLWRLRHAICLAAAFAVLILGFFTVMHLPGNKINVAAPDIGANALKRVTSRGWPLPVGYDAIPDRDLSAAYYEAYNPAHIKEEVYLIKDFDRGFLVNLGTVIAVTTCLFFLLELAIAKRVRTLGE